jgi:hypothetical protein
MKIDEENNSKRENSRITQAKQPGFLMENLV